MIRLYNERYPQIRIRLLDLSANEGLEAVLRGEADFGINMMSGQHPRHRIRAVGRRAFCFSVSTRP